MEDLSGITLQNVIDDLVKIGMESYDKVKSEKTGTPEYKKDCYPFHVKDSITGEFLPDPRVVRWGKILNMVEGFELMQYIYYELPKYGFIGYLRDLDYAWSGIGMWRS